MFITASLASKSHTASLYCCETIHVSLLLQIVLYSKVMTLAILLNNFCNYSTVALSFYRVDTEHIMPHMPNKEMQIRGIYNNFHCFTVLIIRYSSKHRVPQNLKT